MRIQDRHLKNEPFTEENQFYHEVLLDEVLHGFDFSDPYQIEALQLNSSPSLSDAIERKTRSDPIKIELNLI